MTLSQQLLHGKLDSLRAYHIELSDLFTNRDDCAILHDSLALHTAERLVQLLSDTMVDINQHFMRNSGWAFEDSLFSTFIIVAEHGILPYELAKRLAPITGMRNILVHQYEKLDPDLFVRKAREHLSDIPEYARHILTYIEKHPA